MEGFNTRSKESTPYSEAQNDLTTLYAGSSRQVAGESILIPIP